MKTNRPKMTLLIVAAVIVPLAQLSTHFALSVVFERECGGRLKRAADANTVEVARKELDAAVSYLKESGITKGYTSVFYRTPEDDIGFWYSNLSAAKAELDGIKDTSPKLERSNVLMKLRETLLDQNGEGKTIVTTPPGIEVYPSNRFFAAWSTVSGACLLFLLFLLLDKRRF